MKHKSSNNKQTKLAIQEYILSIIDNDGNGFSNDADKMQFVADTFNSEYGHNLTNGRYITKQDAFVGWLQGLPSTFNADFEDDAIQSLLVQWQVIGDDSTEKQIQTSIRNIYWALLYRETCALMKKNNVAF